MGMNTSVTGFRKPDKEFFKMKKVWDACKEANVPIPDDVEEYFDYSRPDNTGIELSLKKYVEEVKGDMEEGFQIEISKLPKNITHIKFTNSY